VQPTGAYSDDTTTTTTTTTTNTITTSGDLDVLNIETTLMPEMNWDRLEEQLRNALQLERCAEVCPSILPEHHAIRLLSTLCPNNDHLVFLNDLSQKPADFNDFGAYSAKFQVSDFDPVRHI